MHRTTVAICIWGCFLASLLAAPVSSKAAPDPDLFDGRVSPSQAGAEPDAASPDVNADEPGEIAGSAESTSGGYGGEGEKPPSRNPEAIGSRGAEQAVASQTSKSGSTVESVTPESNTTEGVSGSGEGSGGIASGSMGDGEQESVQNGQAGQTGGLVGTPTDRDFDAFGFGTVVTDERIEINRSKESNAVSRPGVAAPTSPPAQGSTDNISGGSERETARGTGETGRDLPSGL